MILPESNQLANTHTHPNSRNLRHTHSIAIPQFISSFSKHASFFSFISTVIPNRSIDQPVQTLLAPSRSLHIPLIFLLCSSLLTLSFFIIHTPNHKDTPTHSHLLIFSVDSLFFMSILFFLFFPFTVLEKHSTALLEEDYFTVLSFSIAL